MPALSHSRQAKHRCNGATADLELDSSATIALSLQWKRVSLWTLVLEIGSGSLDLDSETGSAFLVYAVGEGALWTLFLEFGTAFLVYAVGEPGDVPAHLRRGGHDMGRGGAGLLERGEHLTGAHHRYLRKAGERG